jgi:hypothetical protein
MHSEAQLGGHVPVFNCCCAVWLVWGCQRPAATHRRQRGSSCSWTGTVATPEPAPAGHLQPAPTISAQAAAVQQRAKAAPESLGQAWQLPGLCMHDRLPLGSHRTCGAASGKHRRNRHLPAAATAVHHMVNVPTQPSSFHLPMHQCSGQLHCISPAVARARVRVCTAATAWATWANPARVV